MAKKKQLKTNKKDMEREQSKVKKENIFDCLLNKKTLHYSGFCLTDNLTFAFFYADDKIFIDNLPVKDLNRFKFDETEMDMVLDRTTKVEPSKGMKKVNFANYGFIDREIFNTMQKLYPECVFHPVLNFFGQDVNTLLIVLSEEYGKPIGLLKPI